MTTRTSRMVVLAPVLALGILLASPPPAAAQCTYPKIASGGIWMYLKEPYEGENFTISLVNLTDYLLYNSGSLRADQWLYNFQDPFAARPILVWDRNGDGVPDVGLQGVPPYSSVTWKASDATSPTPQHYQGDLVLELTGYALPSGRLLPSPTWPNKFHVYFTPQDADGWLEDSNDNMAGQGTWIALRPDVFSAWEPRNVFRSGVWTTPHFPGNVSLPPAPDDFDMRNIMTIANRWVVVSLYTTNMPLNIVIVVRQTNWTGPAVPTDADPVAGMDTYAAQKLDWKYYGGLSAPRYNTGYYDSPYGRVWGCNYP